MKKLIEIVNNQPMTTSLVVAEQFGRRHDNVMASIHKLIDNGAISLLDFKERDYDNRGKKYPMYELTERGFLIAMPFIGGSKSEQGQAKLVDAFLASHRNPAPETVLPASMPEIQIAEAAARMLRMSESSKVRMLGTICEEKGISTAFLPTYTDEKLTKALGDLLKDHGSKLSSRAVNPMLIAMGHLEELERRSSGGKTKRFKSITEAGLRFGKNETCPRSPNQTQPRYYVDAFPQLLDLINKWASSEDAA